MKIDWTRGGVKLVQAIRTIAAAVVAMTFFSPLFYQLASADLSKVVYDKGITHIERNESIPGKYSQSLEPKYWQEITGTNFPLTLIDWQLVTSPRSTDKYMGKRIIGTVKNSSEKGFSEVKIEFTVYDEEGAQIAIVFSNFDNLKSGGIWSFEIPLTSDVGKAELRGLYLPSKELKELEEKGKKGEKVSISH